MKKINQIIPIILILSLLSGSLSVTASAISENCLTNHFQTIVDNETAHFVPPNIDGSCGYVAMSSLLAFYDSYWHEDFVPDNLEWDVGQYNSFADSLNFTFSAETEYNDLNSPDVTESEFFDKYQTEHLQPYLVKLGESVGCFTLPSSPYGLFDFDAEDILKTYLYTTCGFTEEQVTVRRSDRFTSTDQLKDQIKRQINQGYPVLYFGAEILPGDSSKSIDSDLIENIASGHVMVAYDVADNNGAEDIKLLTGWNNSDIDKRYQWLSETPYDSLHSIIWLEINEENLPHKCSYNYVDSTTDTPLCACQIYSSHPNHDSNHIYLKTGYDSETHFKICPCGDKIDSQSHSIVYTSIYDTEHFEMCVDYDCAYGKLEDHSYNIPTKISNTEHRLDCACGKQGTETEAHNIVSYARIDDSLHNMICSCGYERTAPHIIKGSTTAVTRCLLCGAIVGEYGPILGVNSLTSVNYITENGSYVRADGIIVLSDIDYELFISGELNLEDLINQQCCTE